MIAQIRALIELPFRLLFLIVVRFFPRKRKRVVFGAWMGKRYGCNPRYLVKYMLELAPDFECIWIAEPQVRPMVEADAPGAKFVVRGTFAAYWYLLTAKWYVCNVSWGSDIGGFPTCGRVNILHLGHGIPNKSTGLAQLNGRGKVGSELEAHSVSRLHSFWRAFYTWYCEYAFPVASWVSVAGDWMAKILVETHGKRFSYDRMLYSGTPRNDYMVQNRNNFALKQALKRKLAPMMGIDPEKIWWIYVPTWRHAQTLPFSFTTTPLKARYEKCLRQNNVVLIEKQHPITLDKLAITGGVFGSVYMMSNEVSKQIDVQELLLCCDRLISDYSAIYYDFALLNRPIIEWTYDYEFVAEKDFGLEYDLRVYAPGPFAYTEDELLALLGASDEVILSKRANLFNEHIKYEQGHASEAIVAFMRKINEEGQR